MTDMLQQARERHEQIAKAISQREADIERLKEEADKLDLFVSLAKEIFAQKEAQPAQPEPPEPAPEATAKPAPETPRVMPIRQTQSA